MVFHEKTNGMVVLLLFFVFFGTAIVNAAPTINYCDGDAFICAGYSYLHVYPSYRAEVKNVDGLFNSYLDSISNEFHRPPVKNNELTDTSIVVKTLPPVPKTLLMVVVGFICVSLVKDRRVWLAALTGLVWAGQAGVSILPQLASNITGGGRSDKQSSTQQAAHLHQQKHPFRMRSDIEGTSYIGLLHHLEGIPDTGTNKIIREHKLQEGTERLSIWPSYGICSKYKPLQSISYNKICALLKCKLKKESRFCKEASSYAIATISSYLFQKKECRAPRAGHHVIYSSAFIIAGLARGPPHFN